MPDIGTARIEDAREYGYEHGYVIEVFSFWNRSDPSWAIPAWEEWGYPERAGVFPTRGEAEKAIRH